ncbi:hypothetical protein N431DRAFT_449710 [Stipitochalara longipes BDJ]|nr:hypothetical protein N431DRAFT_449710 [Stipitochalara longipes BDJ]
MASSSSSIDMSTDETGERDFLTPLAPEILLNIVSQLPSGVYFNLVHTSRSLRNFMKLNAKLICNVAIRSRFPLQAALLHSVLDKRTGWLVPTHQKLVEDEERYKSSGSINGILKGDTVGIKVTAPGPQYLHFLEQEILQIFSETEMRLYQYLEKKGTRLGNLPVEQRFYEEEVHGKKYFFKLRVTSVFGGFIKEEKFLSFMQTLNWKELVLRKGCLEWLRTLNGYEGR